MSTFTCQFSKSEYVKLNFYFPSTYTLLSKFCFHILYGDWGKCCKHNYYYQLILRLKYYAKRAYFGSCQCFRSPFAERKIPKRQKLPSSNGKWLFVERKRSEAFLAFARIEVYVDVPFLEHWCLVVAKFQDRLYTILESPDLSWWRKHCTVLSINCVVIGLARRCNRTLRPWPALQAYAICWTRLMHLSFPWLCTVFEMFPNIWGIPWPRVPFDDGKYCRKREAGYMCGHPLPLLTCIPPEDEEGSPSYRPCWK